MLAWGPNSRRRGTAVTKVLLLRRGTMIEPVRASALLNPKEDSRSGATQPKAKWRMKSSDRVFPTEDLLSTRIGFSVDSLGVASNLLRMVVYHVTCSFNHCSTRALQLVTVTRL